jgi:hypothetical protein
MKLSSVIEGYHPYVLGTLGAAIVAWRIVPHSTFSPPAMAGYFTAVLTVSAIAAGFLGTALSVLYSIENKPVVKDLMAAGVWPLLLRYVMTAIKWSFLLSVLSAIGMFAVDRMKAEHYPHVLAVWSLFVFITALLCYRVISLFSRILTSH